jgi:hypothetical protein
MVRSNENSAFVFYGLFMELFKKKVHQACVDVVNEKISYLKKLIDELQQGAKNDSKSTAGDKHETARAMMQLEQEKLTKQLQQYLQFQQQLKSINTDQPLAQIMQGALVQTHTSVFYIAAPLGKVFINETEIMVLSATAPIVSAMKGKKVGEEFTFNQAIYRIENIL